MTLLEAEAIAWIRVLVAYSHKPLPEDLLKQVATFLERFPYEPSVFQRPSPETIEWGKQVVAEMKAEPTRESGSIPATFVGLGEVDIPIANLRCPTCGGGYYRNAQGNLQHDCPQNRGGK
jgi:hypothetical protein